MSWPSSRIDTCPCGGVFRTTLTAMRTPTPRRLQSITFQCIPPQIQQPWRCRLPPPRAIYEDDVEEALRPHDDVTLQPRMVQWFPGHIAKAERQLKTQLSRVDVILEIRDARIPAATSHPGIAQWAGTKPRLLIMNRVDMVSEADHAAWSTYFAQQGQRVLWTNGTSGSGTIRVTKEAVEVGRLLNAARARRGLQPRAVRAVVIGFPNIGKSALINRLLGRRAAKSAAKPGVTRQLAWLRLGGDVDMLDTPGVLPMSFDNQSAAQRLAMCNDIGEAAYVDSLIAAAMVDTLRSLPTGGAIMGRLHDRYGVDPKGITGESFIADLGIALFHGDPERAGQRLLKDYRTGALGLIALEQPPLMPSAKWESDV